jgi:hypothetical protein
MCGLFTGISNKQNNVKMHHRKKQCRKNLAKIHWEFERKLRSSGEAELIWDG